MERKRRTQRTQRTRRASRKAARRRNAKRIIQRAGAEISCTTPPSTELEQYIGGVLYINLDRRQDRRTHIEKEICELGLSKIAHRIPGVLHPQRGAGCTMAHLAALNYAKEKKWKTVLILEDDFKTYIAKDQVQKKLLRFFHTYKDSFDVVMLAHNTNKYTPKDDIVVRIEDSQTTSAYIVSERVYDKLIGVFKEAIDKLIETKNYNAWAADQAWKRLQPELNWYAFKPSIGRQMPSFSDIENKNVDYGV